MKVAKVLLAICLFLANQGNFVFIEHANASVLSDNFRPGELLVKLKGNNEILRLQYDGSEGIESIINQYSTFDAIEFIEPNYLVEVTAFPNDLYLTQQSYLNETRVIQSWSKELLVREQTKNEVKPVIAVLDTGVDVDHPDLMNKIWRNSAEKIDGRDNDQNGFVDDVNGWDFVDGDNSLKPDISGSYVKDAVNHGTIVAGIAAAETNNSAGISGVSWYASIMPLRVLGSDGSGDVFTVIAAIEYAIQKDVDVINMSFVGINYSQAMFNAIKRASDNGIIVVTAAGNTDSEINGIDTDITKTYPVCYDSGEENYVLGVASVDSYQKKSLFSNYGKCVDVVAPGENIYGVSVHEPTSLDFGNLYDGVWAGTSLAAPQVSGLAATLKSLRPDLSGDEIKTLIIETAKSVNAKNPTYNNKLGAGIIDAEAALDKATNYSSKPAGGGKENYIVVGLGQGSFPQIKVVRSDGSEFKTFFAYSPSFTGIINVASADVTGDKKDEIITAAGKGGGPHIRIFNIEGQLVSQFFAYDISFRGGAAIAVGDLDNDTVAEVVTGMGQGGSPEVRIFDYKGNLLSKFMAYDQKFKGGVKVAVGDVDGNGTKEIVTGAGSGGGPHIRVFDMDGNVINQFFAYNQDFRGGVNIATGDLNGDGKEEIVASIEKDSLPTVRIFNNTGLMTGNFFAYEPQYLFGVNVSIGDANNDGKNEIITGLGAGGSSQIFGFNVLGNSIYGFRSHTSSYKGGARTAVMRN